MKFNKTKRAALALGLTLMMTCSFTACAAQTATESNSSGAVQSTEESAAAENDSSKVTQVSTVTDMFTERDLAGTYDESSAVRITLSDQGTEALTANGKTSNDVSVDGQNVTISDKGVYILTGSLSDGQIIVDCGSSEKVQLVLDGVSITNDSSAAIYIKSADKVFVTLAEGSENTLSNTGSYVQTDDNNVDSVIFSKDDLTLNGTGSLTVSAEYGHGIVSKDDLVLADVTLTVTAEKKALDANDSVRIASGTFDLSSGTDAIHADDDDKNVGFVYIADGDITISAGDDAVHALADLTIDGGKINVTKSYEGLEGTTVTINAGDINIVSSDDGINAAGGNDASGFGAGGRKENGTDDQNDTFASSQTCLIQINGGNVHVNAEGDGIDSNGSIEITGGTTFVEGPQGSGNGSLDVGDRSGSAIITGGYFVAAGSSGMSVNFDSASTQGAILLNTNNATGTVTVKDAAGNEIVSETTSKQFNCVQVSTPEIKQGETYTVTAGETDYTVTMDSLIYGNSGGFGGRGGMGGFDNGNGGGQMPGNGQYDQMPRGHMGGRGGMKGGNQGQMPAAPENPDNGFSGGSGNGSSGDADGQIADKAI